MSSWPSFSPVARVRTCVTHIGGSAIRPSFAASVGHYLPEVQGFLYPLGLFRRDFQESARRVGADLTIWQNDLPSCFKHTLLPTGGLADHGQCLPNGYGSPEADVESSCHHPSSGADGHPVHDLVQQRGHNAPVDHPRIPLVLVAAISAGTNTYFEDDDEDDDDGPDGNVGELQNQTHPESGRLTEPQSDEYSYDTGGYVNYASFILYWEDEPDDTGTENDGDTFTLTITSTNNETQTDTVKNDHGSAGEIFIEFPYPEDVSIAGGWNITVTLDEAGEQWIAGQQIIGFTDDSNDYDLTSFFEYYE